MASPQEQRSCPRPSPRPMAKPMSRPIARPPAPREPTLLFTPQPAARRHPNFLHPTISSSAQVPLAGSAALLAVGIWATAEPTTVVAAQGAKAPLKRRPSWEAKSDVRYRFINSRVYRVNPSFAQALRSINKVVHDLTSSSRSQS